MLQIVASLIDDARVVIRILANVVYSFVVMATVIMIVNYNCTVITIVNYDSKTFIAHATEFLVKYFKFFRKGILRNFENPHQGP
jgi:hypothetical protein